MALKRVKGVWKLTSSKEDKDALIEKLNKWLLKPENKQAYKDGTLDRTGFGLIEIDGDQRTISGIKQFYSKGKRIKIPSKSWAQSRREAMKIPERVIQDFAEKEKAGLIPKGSFEKYKKHINSGAKAKDDWTSKLAKVLGIDLDKEHMWSLKNRGSNDPLAQHPGLRSINRSSGATAAFEAYDGFISNTPQNWDESASNFMVRMREWQDSGFSLDEDGYKKFMKGYKGNILTESDMLKVQQGANIDEILARRENLISLKNAGFDIPKDVDELSGLLKETNIKQLVKKAEELGDTASPYLKAQNWPPNDPRWNKTVLPRGNALAFDGSAGTMVIDGPGLLSQAWRKAINFDQGITSLTDFTSDIKNNFDLWTLQGGPNKLATNLIKDQALNIPLTYAFSDRFRKNVSEGNWGKVGTELAVDEAIGRTTVELGKALYSAAPQTTTVAGGLLAGAVAGVVQTEGDKKMRKHFPLWTGAIFTNSGFGGVPAGFYPGLNP